MNRQLWLDSKRKTPEQHRISLKAQRLRANHSRRLRVRKWILEQKNRPCVDCGKQLEARLMHFDHQEPEHKLFTISSNVLSVGWIKLKAEVNKCDIRCYLCHAHRTVKQRELNLI